MTRQPQIVRSKFAAGPSEARAEGGTIILCVSDDYATNGESDHIQTPPISVGVAVSYQRVFVSGTVASVMIFDHPEATMTIELYDNTTDVVIASVDVPSGFPACLTGTVDLAAGDHDLCVRALLPFGYSGSWARATMQVIYGQTVAEPDCLASGGG